MAPLQTHALVEDINRMITGLVSIAVIIAVLGSVLRVPRRRDLVVLSFGLVAGVIGQIVLGGLVVLSHLYPPFVMGHFILSLLILWCAMTLHHRADDNPSSSVGTGPPPPPVDPTITRLGRFLMAATGVVVVLGTIVTGSGPHPGANGRQVVKRLPMTLHDAARMHGIAVFLLVAGTAALGWLVITTGAPAGLRRRVEVVLVVMVAQATVGYIQYFSRLPAALVGIHIAGAAAVWASVVWLNQALTVAQPEPKRDSPPVLVGI